MANFQASFYILPMLDPRHLEDILTKPSSDYSFYLDDSDIELALGPTSQIHLSTELYFQVYCL